MAEENMSPARRALRGRIEHHRAGLNEALRELAAEESAETAFQELFPTIHDFIGLPGTTDDDPCSTPARRTDAIINHVLFADTAVGSQWNAEFQALQDQLEKSQDPDRPTPTVSEDGSSPKASPFDDDAATSGNALPPTLNPTEAASPTPVGPRQKVTVPSSQGPGTGVSAPPTTPHKNMQEPIKGVDRTGPQAERSEQQQMQTRSQTNSLPTPKVAVGPEKQPDDPQDSTYKEGDSVATPPGQLIGDIQHMRKETSRDKKRAKRQEKREAQKAIVQRANEISKHKGTEAKHLQKLQDSIKIGAAIDIGPQHVPLFRALDSVKHGIEHQRTFHPEENMTKIDTMFKVLKGMYSAKALEKLEDMITAHDYTDALSNVKAPTTPGSDPSKDLQIAQLKNLLDQDASANRSSAWGAMREYVTAVEIYLWWESLKEKLNTDRANVKNWITRFTFTAKPRDGRNEISLLKEAAVCASLGFESPDKHPGPIYSQAVDRMEKNLERGSGIAPIYQDLGGFGAIALIPPQMMSIFKSVTFAYSRQLIREVIRYIPSLPDIGKNVDVNVITPVNERRVVPANFAVAKRQGVRLTDVHKYWMYLTASAPLRDGQFVLGNPLDPYQVGEVEHELPDENETDEDDGEESDDEDTDENAEAVAEADAMEED